MLRMSGLWTGLLGSFFLLAACGTSVRKGQSQDETVDLAGDGDAGDGEDLSAGSGDDAGLPQGCAPSIRIMGC